MTSEIFIFYSASKSMNLDPELGYLAEFVWTLTSWWLYTLTFHTLLDASMNSNDKAVCVTIAKCNKDIRITFI